jgi:uncharacterized membrane protein YeaQ/YmgE (transglycosylase-associated protein family)
MRGDDGGQHLELGLACSISFEPWYVATGKSGLMPDIVNLIIWLIAGVAGGNAAGDLLKGHYDLGLKNTGYGAIGGVVGALILQTLIPALRGIDYGPIIGQAIVAAVSGAGLTVSAGAVARWRRNRSER